MNLKGLFSIVIFFTLQISVVAYAQEVDYIQIKPTVIDTDSLLENSFNKTKLPVDTTKIEPVLINPKQETKIIEPTEIHYTLPDYIEIIPVDTFILYANPLLIDLVFQEMPLNYSWNKPFDFKSLIFGKQENLSEGYVHGLKFKPADQIIFELRNNVRKKISEEALYLYALRFDQLPDPKGNKNRIIEGKSITNIRFVENDLVRRSNNKSLVIKKVQLGPWQSKAIGMAQFSQNLVSGNWYQGGNSNMAVLGVLSGQLNYDNKKNIQFENNAEWKMGFYFVDDSTALRAINTNNDILKLNSKLGFKIDGNWYYSGYIDFTTQFFNNYKSISSGELKASFLTPVRFNAGIGLDYKYKKTFSLAVSPLSYKYIYVNDTLQVNPNLFGIKKGTNTLSEIGSAFKAQFSYSPVREIQLDSKLNFYTNYEKVEIDWEIIGNFTVNRFLSTRLSINPRYDNTVIMPNGDKAKIQFKELLSFGFSYKFLN